MSYHAQAQLTNDSDFQARNASAAVQQATQPQNAGSVADRVRRGDSEVTFTFTRLAAAGPGIADKAATPEGGVDQSRVTDADLLSLTQANWSVVAALYPDGSTP